MHWFKPSGTEHRYHLGPGGRARCGLLRELTSPVVAGTGDIFVGCSDEKLYGFTPSGGLIAGSPLSVGDGSTTVNGNVGGIVDPPLVDVVNGFRCAVGVSTSPSTLYGVGFDNSSHVMTSGPAANFVQVTNSFNTEFSTVTEF